MSTQKLKNRWLIAVSAVGIHISIGSVYAYSVMTNPVKDIFDEEVLKTLIENYEILFDLKDGIKNI